MLIGSHVTELIKLESLRDLIAAGLVTTATVLGQKGGYTVHVAVGNGERFLVNRAGQVRVFASIDTAVRELNGVGLTTVAVNVSGYEKGLVRAPRADLTLRARRVAEALEYDQWVRERVDEAMLDESLGRSEWKSHEDVWENVRRETARLMAERHGGGSVKANARTRKKGE